MNFVWWDPSYFIVWLAPLVNVFQAVKIIQLKDSSQISYGTYSLLLTVLISYAIHAVRILLETTDWVFLYSNGVGVAVCAWVIFLIWNYRKGYSKLKRFFENGKAAKNNKK